MWLQLLISVIGWSAVHRILRILIKKRIISERFSEKIQFVLITMLLFLLIAHVEVSKFCFLVSVFGMSLLLLPKSIQLKRKKEFQNRTLEALDTILLSIRAGKSFREALAFLQNGLFGHYYSEISKNILLRQPSQDFNSDYNINKVYQELLSCEQTNFRVAEKLKSFRYGLYIEQKFRNKAHQATLQARAQSTILSIMYAVALVFVLSQVELITILPAILMSLLMFSIGTFWIWKMGRSHKWKV